MNTPSSQVRTAVVGVGRMGQHHARVLSQLPMSKLTAIVDARIEQARKIASQYGAQAFASVDELHSANLGVQAATVAVPTIYHADAANKLLASGVDVLIEKPLAPSPEIGRQILDAAKAHGRIVAVGHTERFNPAMVALKKYQLKPMFIEVHRISPMTFRSIDVGVVLDMMIHDLDIVAHLVGSPVKDVTAVGVRVVAEYEDIANARLTFANGCVANITASRLALKTERKMRLFSPTAYVTVDFAKKAGAVITKTANQETLDRVRAQIAGGQIADLTQLNYPEIVKYEDLQVVEVEPLKAEQDNFLNAVIHRTQPEVTGEAGLTAVDIASRIGKCIAEHRWEA
jgi:predicted dehydrogenase